MSQDNKLNILAIIPARSGSKSIIDKNIRIINGKPLLAYSIEHAKASKYINRIIISTDSKEYGKIAEDYGAEFPFLRPNEISDDFSTDIEVFVHALNYLKENENYTPDVCVHLRPTYPTRNVSDIDRSIEILMANPQLDSVRSISEFHEPPFKMWFRNEKGNINPVVKLEGIKDAHSIPRQQLPKAYLQNACTDIIRTSTILSKKSMAGDTIYGYIMDGNLDIDFEDQLRVAAESIKLNSSQKRFCFDIDGVIATITKDNDYNLANPIESNIQLINKLYNSGHYIVLNTARGYVTKIDWKDVTQNQLKNWGVLYNELIMGSKPNADYYIDDKNIDIDILRKLMY